MGRYFLGESSNLQYQSRNWMVGYGTFDGQLDLLNIEFVKVSHNMVVNKASFLVCIYLYLIKKENTFTTIYTYNKSWYLLFLNILTWSFITKYISIYAWTQHNTNLLYNSWTIFSALMHSNNNLSHYIKNFPVLFENYENQYIRTTVSYLYTKSIMGTSSLPWWLNLQLISIFVDDHTQWKIIMR